MKIIISQFTWTLLAWLLLGACLSPDLGAEYLSIYDIQYTDSADGTSNYHGSVVNCAGGIVVHKRFSSRPRLFLIDPNFPAGWGGIQVKDWFGDSFDTVETGDWIQLTNVTVEDFRGTTFLQYWDSNPDYSLPSFTIISSGNPLPSPIPVSLDEIPSPLQDPYDPYCWYVTDHRAEKYESMLLQINRVVVTALDLGKAYDNYVLQSVAYPTDPNISCWATDYLNQDLQYPNLYLPEVALTKQFCRVRGVLEQYLNLSNGFDYYQLMTLTAQDLIVFPISDLDGDCRVNLFDFSHFSLWWLTDQLCADPNWCGGADLTLDGHVNVSDLQTLSQYWLEGVND